MSKYKTMTHYSTSATLLIGFIAFNTLESCGSDKITDLGREEELTNEADNIDLDLDAVENISLNGGDTSYNIKQDEIPKNKESETETQESHEASSKENNTDGHATQRDLIKKLHNILTKDKDEFAESLGILKSPRYQKIKISIKNILKKHENTHKAIKLLHKLYVEHVDNAKKEEECIDLKEVIGFINNFEDTFSDNLITSSKDDTANTKLYMLYLHVYLSNIKLLDIFLKNAKIQSKIEPDEYSRLTDYVENRMKIAESEEYKKLLANMPQETLEPSYIKDIFKEKDSQIFNEKIKEATNLWKNNFPELREGTWTTTGLERPMHLNKKAKSIENICEELIDVNNFLSSEISSTTFNKESSKEALQRVRKTDEYESKKEAFFKNYRYLTKIMNVWRQHKDIEDGNEFGNYCYGFEYMGPKWAENKPEGISLKLANAIIERLHRINCTFLYIESEGDFISTRNSYFNIEKYKGKRFETTSEHELNELISYLHDYWIISGGISLIVTAALSAPFLPLSIPFGVAGAAFTIWGGYSLLHDIRKE